MSNNLKIQVGSKKFIGSQDENIVTSIPLETQYRELIQGDRTVDVALSDRFYFERQSTKIYRLYGKFYIQEPQTPLNLVCLMNYITIFPLRHLGQDFQRLENFH